jgi:hypothetical protein
MSDQKDEDNGNRMHIECFSETQRLQDKVVNQPDDQRKKKNGKKHLETAEFHQRNENGKTGADYGTEIGDDIGNAGEHSDQ